jgi:hypothetical protein
MTVKPTASTVEQFPAIETGGEILPDGSALELIRPSADSDQVQLLRWRGKILERGTEIAVRGQRYTPVPVDAGYLKALRLPSRVAPPECTRQLFEDVRDLIKSSLRQLDPCATALTFALFASWLAPVLPMAPLLAIFAPPGTPKNLALRLLSILCRRPLRLVGLKRADLLKLPMQLHPTLLLDEPALSAGMQNLFKAGAHRGSFAPGADGLRDLFGPKFLISSRPFVRSVLGADALRVTLVPVSGKLRQFNPGEEEQLAEEFQARFLSYFLRNFGRTTSPEFDVSQLSQPFQELAQTFGAALLGDAELQSAILPLIGVQDEELRADAVSSTEAMLIEACLFFIHRGDQRVRAADLAEQVRAISLGRALEINVSPESVGWACRRLGIPSGRIDRAGNGVELKQSTCWLIHELAVSYQVRAIPGALRAECPYCREIAPLLSETKK